MCYAIDHRYHDCRHLQKRDIIDNCGSGGSGDLIILCTVAVMTPKLCPACFRAASDRILERHEPSIRGIESTIAHLESRIEAGELRGADDEAGDLQGDIERLGLSLRRRKATLTFELAALRDEHGVWREG